MENEQNKIAPSESEQQTGGDTTAYIEAIKEMKNNSVDKKVYDKLKEDNAKLLDALVNGEELPEQKAETVDIPALRNSLFNEENSNLEYVQKALKLRQAILDKEGKDIFVPQGRKIVATADDYDSAERVAKALQSAVDYADGDSDIFTSELQRIMKDTGPIQNNRKR